LKQQSSLLDLLNNENRLFAFAFLIQVIVLPRAGHAPHHQYPDLVANYITGFIHGWK
jgi:pimeloyl-ACP methyl ester carboxylesterase